MISICLHNVRFSKKKINIKTDLGMPKKLRLIYLQELLVLLKYHQQLLIVNYTINY